MVSDYGNAHLRLGVLISGSGSNLQALIDAIESKDLQDVAIALVVSNRAGAQGLQRALRHKIPAIYLPWKEPRENEAKLVALLRLFQVDLIVLAGWMRILSAGFLAQFPRRIINLHPALLPDDGTGSHYITADGTAIPAFRGLHAVRQALEAGVTITGSTVHYVTAEVDAGPVICREELKIEPGDTEESLHERIKRVEHRLIVEAVRRLRSEFAWRAPG
ncbi:MAG TPA: phosphoribosylglycinamide formyltransferase [Ktedonobacteraceae bacterium]|jgi:phosphoribosylglycinamide formyltransferase-1|nr:phosphoribosylglycinamide formyltransferase [Ktedonobacteraceae bacterium]